MGFRRLERPNGVALSAGERLDPLNQGRVVSLELLELPDRGLELELARFRPVLLVALGLLGLALERRELRSIS
jgi:hypothetical protein